MQTIIVLLDPRKLENPIIDLYYYIPDRIKEVSDGIIITNEPTLGCTPKYFS